MKNSPSKRSAYEYAERVRARLPRRLQELRLAAGQSRYRLELESGITREMIGKVERGASNPSVCVTAQLCHGMGITLNEFTAHLEDVSRT
jgi:transcriptional regulator with XRE-family HTH domain